MYSQYLSDPEIKALTEDAALIRCMLCFEIALAKVQAQLGIIPEAGAGEIAERLGRYVPDPEILTAGTVQNGIVTIPLLAAAKEQLSAETRDFLHWGATSQDVLDTAVVLIVRDVLQVFEERLSDITGALRAMARKHAHTCTVARTRGQQAVPVSFGLKVMAWLQPLERHLARLDQIKPRLLVLQLGGAGGDLAALGEKAWDTAQLLATELDLSFAGVWHSQRDTIAEFAAWLALVAGSFGKMARDILLLSQTEVGELRERKSGGGSSTMPHKNNPVLSEAIVALARYTAQLAGNCFQAVLHERERDGAALALEWLSLAPMMIATGTILRHALVISSEIEVDEEAMAGNLARTNGLAFSEQAGFLLTPYMSRAKARQIVQEACQTAQHEQIPLADVLNNMLPEIPLNWREELQPRPGMGMTEKLLNLGLDNSQNEEQSSA